MENKIIATGVCAESNKNYMITYRETNRTKKTEFVDNGITEVKFDKMDLLEIIKAHRSVDYENKKAGLGGIIISNDFLFPTYDYLISKGESPEDAEDLITILLELCLEDSGIIEKELENLNYDKLTLSQSIQDNGGHYSFRLLYTTKEDCTHILIKDLEKNILETKDYYKIYNKTPTDLYNSPKPNDSISLLKMCINLTVNKSGIIVPSIEDEVNNITDFLIKSLYDLNKSSALEDKKKEFYNACFNDFKIKQYIIDTNEKHQESIINLELFEIKKAFKNRKGLPKATQRLGNYLNEVEGIILRKTVHDIYKLDAESNGYKEVTIDDLIKLMEILFGEKNLIHDNDLKDAILFISDRLEPKVNIVKFNNCLYSMKEHKVIESEEPIFTLVECPFNYNPNAKGSLIDKFLYESLEVKEDKIVKGENGGFITIPKEDLTNEKIKGVKQIIGYLFASGNPLTALIFVVGISGSGKTLFGNLLTEMFGGTEKIGDKKLSELEKYTHATSGLVNKHLNLIRDSPDEIITNNGMIKQLSGNEDLPINPKGKTPYELNKDYVPKTVLIANNLPIFKNIQEAILERLVTIEFTTKFRGTPKQDPELLNKILSNPEEMEDLIYTSLKAYEDMMTNKEDFILRIDKDTTLELLLKHSKPLEFVIKLLITKIDEKASKTEEEFGAGVIYTDDLKELCLKVARDKGIEVGVNQHGEIPSKKLMEAIKGAFDLETFVDEDGKPYNTKVRYDVSKGKNRRYYPYLIKSDLYEEYYEKLTNE